MMTYLTVKTAKAVAGAVSSGGGNKKGGDVSKPQDLGLLPNEGVIMHEISVNHSDPKLRYNEELYLTNLNLICINRINKKKSNIFKYPLEQIAETNGQYHVYLGKYKFGTPCLNVDIYNGTQTFVFQSKDKQVINSWINNIISVIVTNKENGIGVEKNGLGEIKEALDSLGKNMETAAEVIVSKKCLACSAPLNGKTGELVKCRYCDTEQAL